MRSIPRWKRSMCWASSWLMLSFFHRCGADPCHATTPGSGGATVQMAPPVMAWCRRSGRDRLLRRGQLEAAVAALRDVGEDLPVVAQPAEVEQHGRLLARDVRAEDPRVDLGEQGRVGDLRAGVGPVGHGLLGGLDRRHTVVL